MRISTCLKDDDLFEPFDLTQQSGSFIKIDVSSWRVVSTNLKSFLHLFVETVHCWMNENFYFPYFHSSKEFALTYGNHQTIKKWTDCLCMLEPGSTLQGPDHDGYARHYHCASLSCHVCDCGRLMDCRWDEEYLCSFVKLLVYITFVNWSEFPCCLSSARKLDFVYLLYNFGFDNFDLRIHPETKAYFIINKLL